VVVGDNNTENEAYTNCTSSDSSSLPRGFKKIENVLNLTGYSFFLTQMKKGKIHQFKII
jgi:hypothetical protein